MSPTAAPARRARLSSASKRSSKPRRFSAPVSGSARETRLSSLRWCSWLARLPGAHPARADERQGDERHLRWSRRRRPDRRRATYAADVDDGDRDHRRSG